MPPKKGQNMYIRENEQNKHEACVMTFPNKDAINHMLIHTKQQKQSKVCNQPESQPKSNLFGLILAVLLSDSDIDTNFITLLALLL